jgi:hypothetical protein
MGTTTLWSSTTSGVTYHPVGPRANSSVTGWTYLESAPPAGFNGAGTNGKWRLVLTDHYSSDTGSNASWTLRITP